MFIAIPEYVEPTRSTKTPCAWNAYNNLGVLERNSGMLMEAEAEPQSLFRDQAGQH